MRVEPEYELVTRTLRGEWEAKLGEVKNLEREREQALCARPPELRPAERQAILDLARDMPAVWKADTTTPAERKQIIRLLIKDVALIRSAQNVRMAVRWQTGACSALEVPLPGRGAKLRTDPELVALIRKLAADHTNQMIAEHLNAAGWKTKKGKRFTRAIVQELRFRNKVLNRCPALTRKVSYEPRGDGRLGTKAVARRLNVGTTTVNRWCREGRLDCTRDAPGSPLWIKLTEDDVRALRRPLRRGHSAPPPRIKPSSAKAVAKAMVSDSVWEAIAPFMPPEPQKINGARPRVTNRAVMCAVLFILRHEITWWALPPELGWGCGANCRRRFLEWLKTGAWARIQAKLVKLLPDGGRLEWQRTFS
jgi:transposase